MHGYQTQQACVNTKVLVTWDSYGVSVSKEMTVGIGFTKLIERFLEDEIDFSLKYK